MIRGKKGGKGGGGHTYHEDPNNLKSVSTAKVLDLISEGEIVGLVNGAKSVYLDDVPLQNEDNSYNFNGVTLEMRNGLPEQDFLPGFSSVESFVQVGQELKYGLPVTKRVQDENLDAIILTMEFPNLSQQDTENGDMLQYSVQFRVRIRADEGVWQDSGVITVAGKCISSFQRSYYFKVPQSQDGVYEIQVSRVSPDDDSASKHSITNWYGFSRVIEAKLSYPNRAVCGLTVRADQFGSNVPSRKYEVYGLLVQVPSNYDAWNHTYSSEVWDGTFKRSWTNNPAWIFYDLMTNGRYGLGRDIKPEYIDKYGLYMIGRYCDELVSDGNGGMEPRFTFNGTITNRESAYSVLNNLAGLFNSMIYYSGSVITLVQDSPKTPVRDFAPANVIDGQFNYEGVARSARHSVIQVTYANPNDMYNSSIEVVENPEMIQDLGWKSSEITLVGCTSRAQARRRALRDVYTEQHETETVTFGVGIENADLVPGDIIRIADPSYAGARYGGRIVDLNPYSGEVTLDAEVDFTVSTSWMLGFLLPDNTWQELPVYATGVSNRVVFSSLLGTYPEIGTVWTLQCEDVEPQLFRVLSIKEDKPYQYTITALRHFAQKYDIIEGGKEFVEGSFSRIPSGALKAPNALAVEQYLHRLGDAIIVSLTVSWNSTDARTMNFMVRYKRKGDVIWTDAGYTASESFTLDNIEKDVYTIQVQALDALGRRSSFSEIVFDAPGYQLLPSDVTGFHYRIDPSSGILWKWDACSDMDFQNYCLTISNEVDENGDLTEIRSSTQSYSSAPYNFTGTISANIVAENFGGMQSANPASAEVQIVAPSAPQVVSAELLDNGVVVNLKAKSTTWDIAHSEVVLCNSSTNTHIFNTEVAVLPLPSNWRPDSFSSVLSARTKDIFNNWSASSIVPISWYAPSAPVVTVNFNSLNGAISVAWQDCRNSYTNAPQIDHYEVAGVLANNALASTKGTNYEIVVPKEVYDFIPETSASGVPVTAGHLDVVVTAVDKYGVATASQSVPFKMYPPKEPSGFGMSASVEDTSLVANWTEGGAIVLTWADCTTTFAIDYYKITDMHTNTVYKVSTNYVVLQPRMSGLYPIKVLACDILGQTSREISYDLRIKEVSGMEVTAKIDGADILVSWNTPNASFAIDHYVIMQDNDEIPDGSNNDINLSGFLGTAKSNYFRTPAGRAGTYQYYVWAVDSAGNVSKNYSSYAEVQIDVPNAPKGRSFVDSSGGIQTDAQVSINLYENGLQLSWSENKTDKTLPITTWEVQRYAGFVSVENLTNHTPIEEYGKLDVNTTSVPAFSAGDYTFAIRGIDSAGNLGKYAVVEFSVGAPGQVTISDPVIIDSNVQLTWTPPNKIYFPIKEYLFEEVEVYDDGSSYRMEIGRVDALFASTSEQVAGLYTYSITPIDVGGNFGTPRNITCRVSQPPDFVFYAKIDSNFAGGNARPEGSNGRTNLVLDGQGHMYGPVPENETWEENLARIKSITGKPVSTFADKVNAGYATWLEPAGTIATYVETTNHGTTIPSSNLVVTVTSRPIVPTTGTDPQIMCKLEISSDGVDWEVLTEDSFSAFASNFQYSRVTLTITGGYIEISKILIDLHVKELTDYGRVQCRASDGGTGMETGTFVPFTAKFVSVTSLPKPNVLNEPDYNAYVVFDGSQISPAGFRIYVLDKNGNRVDALVDWVAYGV